MTGTNNKDPGLERKRLQARRVRKLVLTSTAIMLMLCTYVGYQARISYYAAIEDSKINNERLDAIIAEHINQTYQAADLTLLRAVEKHNYNELFGGNLAEHLEQQMQGWVDGTPQISAMMILDAEGSGVVAVHRKKYSGWIDYSTHNYADLDIYEQLRDEKNTTGFAVSQMPRSTGEGSELMLVGRRLTNMDGSFGGIVMAAIDPNRFITFYQSLLVGKNAMMVVTSLDSDTLTTSNEKAPKILNERLRDSEEFFRKNPKEFLRPAAQMEIDGRQKILSHVRLKQAPIMLTLVTDEVDYLRDWRADLLKDGGFLAIFLVFGSVLSLFSLAVTRQISRIEESEAAAVLASQAKSEFLANMSHELRTPLNAIIGFSEMMMSGYFGPLNAKQKERIQDINLCGSHLLHLITDILEFSKGEAGKLELVEEKVNLPDIAGESMRMTGDKVKVKGLNLISDIAEDLPMMLGDKRKIRQILINLISNSVKFTPEGGTIKLSVKLDPYRNMHMTVSDTGIGIAPEDIPVALSVFGQVHRSQSHQGTGLGLPLCKMFAELHGGRLAIGSAVGEGTTVRIVFPASRVLPPVAENAANDDSAAAASKAKS